MKKFFSQLWEYAKNGLLWIFLFFVIFMAVLGIWYNRGLQPGTDTVKEIIAKFTVDSYSIPYHVAERYLTWFHMRTFFFGLDYLLTLLGIVASLMTVFYASTDARSTPATNVTQSTQIASKDQKRKNMLVFLSLLSLSFTRCTCPS